jgi:hypothetical protein
VLRSAGVRYSNQFAQSFNDSFPHISLHSSVDFRSTFGARCAGVVH